MKNYPDNFSKTKMLCTLGPATSSLGTIKQLLNAGTDGVRLNFSHGNYDFYETLYHNIHEACVAENLPLAVLIDLQGPKIRLGELSQPEIYISTGDIIKITTDDHIGTKEMISTSYKSLVDDARIGDKILIDDGLIKLRITGKEDKSVICEIEEGGILRPKKGMNLPGMKLSTASVTEKDFRDLEFALKHRVDFIALSFVREAEDVIKLKEWLKKKNSSIPVIAKIEKPEAVENFESILNAADGIMVARGDLGVEMAPQEVPIIQKKIILRCNAVGKLVITATQMLESMVNNPVPTRAEASDVANAVWDGTDVVMLSAETSVGKFPVQSVKIMNDILKNSDDHSIEMIEHKVEVPSTLEENLFDSVGRAISMLSKQVNARAIVVLTNKGRTAINFSKFRPKAKIIALSDSFDTMNKLCLRWGVIPVYMDSIDKEHMAIDKAKKIILENGCVKKDDVVVFASGAPYSDKSRVNWLRIEVIE
ncbi:MAG: pyruvate kinase [Ignavibacteriales bacterium]|nr:MAG: pyruvate kinase [Ignavibacteriales bacterium]